MATNKNKSNGNNKMSNKKPDSANLKFLINAQYLKDLSFENPKAPNSLRQISNENAPKFQIDANVTSRPLNDHGENIFEVELSIKSETKTNDSTLFIVEGVYCGIFTIENATEDILDKSIVNEFAGSARQPEGERGGAVTTNKLRCLVTLTRFRGVARRVQASSVGFAPRIRVGF